MFYCQKYKFWWSKPHLHTERFASAVSGVLWVGLASAGILNTRLTQEAFSFFGGNVKLGVLLFSFVVVIQTECCFTII